MRYFALACDYDGTIARDGHVASSTVNALQRVVDSGRRLILVTGRELDELLAIFPEIGMFEWVVAENGGLLYRPSNREEKKLAESPPASFLLALQRRGVGPLSAGRVIVATWEPHQQAVLETIRQQGLDLQVIFNKGAVMVLPAGVNKASGLRAALKLMNLTPHEVVGVGDAENDHAFLKVCERSAAVANALPVLKDQVTQVLRGDHGKGVVELIESLLGAEFADHVIEAREPQLLIGAESQGRDVSLPAFGGSVLIAGPSGSGKSTTTTSLLERLSDQQYQFCVIDPEGDYESVPFAIAVGTGDRGPSVEEVLQVLAQPEQNVVVNLIGLRLADRPGFFSRLLPQLLELRQRVGRPHWLIVDEAHHLLPPNWELARAYASELNRTVFITVHPREVHPDVLTSVETVIAVGAKPQETLAQFCEVVGNPLPESTAEDLDSGEVVVWRRRNGASTDRVKVAPNNVERQRHIRKYSEGELPEDRSFYFKGPRRTLHLRAQNLMMFLQLADGVDDETWSYHLQRGDYSRWIRGCIKDDELSQEVASLERQMLSPRKARDALRDAVERRYTLPASTTH